MSKLWKKINSFNEGCNWYSKIDGRIDILEKILYKFDNNILINVNLEEKLYEKIKKLYDELLDDLKYYRKLKIEIDGKKEVYFENLKELIGEDDE